MLNEKKKIDLAIQIYFQHCNVFGNFNSHWGKELQLQFFLTSNKNNKLFD